MRVAKYRVPYVILLLATVACSPVNRADTSLSAGTLRIGVLPDQNPQTLIQIHKPLTEYLAASVGVETELFIPRSYEELLGAFDRGRIELAWFGGLTFIRAEQESQAEPLVMRDIDLEFTSDFLVPQEASEQTLEDFSGRRFSFGPKLSTSGHLMPRYFLRLRGIEPETFFSEVRYSAGHDQTLFWVSDDVVDLGAANSEIVESMPPNGRSAHEGVRVLERTPPYRDYLWAAQSHLDPDLRDRLLDAFLALDRTVPAHRALLEPLGAGGFIPASSGDYLELRLAADMLDALEGAGSK